MISITSMTHCDSRVAKDRIYLFLFILPSIKTLYFLQRYNNISDSPNPSSIFFLHRERHTDSCIITARIIGMVCATQKHECKENE